MNYSERDKQKPFFEIRYLIIIAKIIWHKKKTSRDSP